MRVGYVVENHLVFSNRHNILVYNHHLFNIISNIPVIKISRYSSDKNNIKVGIWKIKQLKKIKP